RNSTPRRSRRTRFVTRSTIASARTVRRQTPTGAMNVSTPEQTALDLVEYPHVAGGWDNVASVLAELGPQIRPDAVVDLISQAAHPRAIQRLGHLLDLVRADDAARALADELAPRALLYVAFEPSASIAGAARDDRWHLIMNRTFEVE
ncbi:MAG: type IV toxin-antitoxin system AbiEi family antitoxin, partial [Chloroflexota bacterium]